MRFLLALVPCGLSLTITAGPAAADASCASSATLETISTVCQYPAEEARTLISSSSSTVSYSVHIVCASDQADATCSNPRLCADPPNTILYNVIRSENGGPGALVGTTCLDANDPLAPPVITPDMVATQFQALSWPESRLEIQPPGGRTLVNLETNFYTGNTEPTSQTVTLLGQQVEIEATPSSWTWRHGDGTDQTTSEPGRAYPDLDITHTYTAVGDALSPSVDTTYSGRYRVNGGSWIDIPATVTVAGAAGALDVVPAKPQLVAAR